MSKAYRVLLVAVLSLLAATSSLAAQQAVITGRVLDRETRLPLTGAQASAGSVAAQANEQGVFTLRVGAGTVSVTIVAIGYETAERTVTVAAGQTVGLEVYLDPNPIAIGAVIVSATRDQAPIDAGRVPAATDVVRARDIQAQPARTVGDYVENLAGVDAPQAGINARSIVTRGFNNVFSGSLLVLTDYRYARVPSLRLNSYSMIPTPALDIERIEMVLGPGSALYGPNSANGIMHIITTSPIDDPGTSVSVGGGNRSIFTGAFREGIRFSDRAGLKVAGQYFRGRDFEYRDPFEIPSASNPLIANRDFDVERFGGEARLDLRPWEGSTDGVSLTYGLNQLANAIELTGIGAGQAKDWRYQYGQVRFRRSGLFAQGFVNASDAGDTYLLRTGQPIVDKSYVLAGQVQYSFAPLDRLDFTAGTDYSKTVPRTEGSINGANEDSDNITEYGAYLSGRVELLETLDLVAALRMDDHQYLENKVWSPRVGLVFEPVDGQSFRATYNRAFSTPSTNNLFLDITAATIPLLPGIAYDVRTLGVPTTGFTWNDQCAGGVSSYCMYSPFASGQLPATGTIFWNGVVVPAILANPTAVAGIYAMGLDSASFAAAVASPTPADIASVLRRLDSETGTFPLDPGVTPVERIRPTITNTYEVGYQGLLASRVRLSGSVYYNQIRDFVGPLRVETPSVFLDGPSVASFVAARLVSAGVPAGPAASFAASVASTAAAVPFGTVAPDQRSNPSLVLTYRNFGDVSMWGADVGLEAEITPKVSALGSYSWVSKECFDQNDDGLCTSSIDLALNAPTNKGSFGLRYRDRGFRGSGLEVGARARFSGEFPMNSGVYIGTVKSYTVFDANAAYEIPQFEGATLALTVNNIFDKKHQEFIGAPEMGMLALLQLTYVFGGR
jgi:outer membrane receptor for ferrienterochelin and colicins